MPKALSNGRRKVTILPVAPADQKNPTIAEVSAGLDISCRILSDGFGLAVQASETVAEGSLCDTAVAEVPTVSKASGDLTLFRYFNATGKPETAAEDTEDGIGDGAHQALKVKGSEVWLVTRFTNKASTEDFAAGDPVSVFKVVTDVPREAEATGYIKSVVPVSASVIETEAVVAT